MVNNGELDAEITHRVQAGGKNWKKMTGVLCDKRVNVKAKGKMYKTVVRPAMIYGAETWGSKKAQEKRLDVTEMRMLRWMCGVTKLDKIKNERIRKTVKVTEISKKIQEKRLKWYGHVMRKGEDYVGKNVMNMEIQGTRGRGRPRKRWMDRVKEDLREKGLTGDEVHDRDCWRGLIRNVDPA